jgi:murein DD-endopeptidase MepM/ murein hydrolase activator NlpD
LESISQQKLELESQLQGIQGEYLSEIEALRDSERNSQNNSTDCAFEDVENLEIPDNYFTRPVFGYVTQNFHCGHDGVDIASSLGSDIFSVADGQVVRIGPKSDGCVGLNCNGGFGNFVVIKHTLPSGQKIYSLYAHMQNQTFRDIGENVNKGDIIGRVGCTGYTVPYPCGVHVHFMILSDTYEIGGIGCRLGRATCYNPQKLINPIS